MLNLSLAEINNLFYKNIDGIILTTKHYNDHCVKTIFSIEKTVQEYSEKSKITNLQKLYDIDAFFGTLSVENITKAFPDHGLEIFLNLASAKNMARNLKYKHKNTGISKNFNLKIAQVQSFIGCLDVYLILPDIHGDFNEIRNKILKYWLKLRHSQSNQ